MTRYIIDSSSLNELEDRYPADISVFEPIYFKLNRSLKRGIYFRLGKFMKN